MMMWPKQPLSSCIFAIILALSVSSLAWADNNDDNDQDNNQRNNHNQTNHTTHHDLNQFFKKAKYRFLEGYSPHQTFSLGDN